jgi:hypothetical protein
MDLNYTFDFSEIDFSLRNQIPSRWRWSAYLGTSNPQTPARFKTWMTRGYYPWIRHIAMKTRMNIAPLRLSLILLNNRLERVWFGMLWYFKFQRVPVPALARQTFAPQSTFQRFHESQVLAIVLARGVLLPGDSPGLSCQVLIPICILACPRPSSLGKIRREVSSEKSRKAWDRSSPRRRDVLFDGILIHGQR